MAMSFVVCAHCGTVLENAEMNSKTVSALLGSMGSLGVPVFFFLSGYVFSYKPFIICLKAKTKSLLVPWIASGSIVYLYVYLRKGGLSINSFLRWLLGDGSYLWFLSVTVCLIIVGEILICGAMKLWWRYRVAIIILIVLSFMVNVLEFAEIIELHPYLNIFRWMWVFILGLAMQDTHYLDKMPGVPGCTIAFIVVLFICSIFGVSTNYWSYNWYLFSALTILVFSFVPLQKGCISKLFVDIGKKSFAIYLLHMPVAGVVTNLCNRIHDTLGIITFARPYVVISATYGFILLIEIVSDRIHCKKWIQLLIGSR